MTEYGFDTFQLGTVDGDKKGLTYPMDRNIQEMFWCEQYTKRSAKQNSYVADTLQHNKGYTVINTL